MEKDDMQMAKDTLLALILGTLASGVVFGVLGMFFAGTRGAFVLGILLGTVTACGIAVHIYKSVEKSLDMQEESSVGYTRKMALLRSGLMGIPMILSILLPEYLHPLGVLLGLLGLKFGAFLQPVLMRLIQKKKKKVRESAE